MDAGATCSTTQRVFLKRLLSADVATDITAAGAASPAAVPASSHLKHDQTGRIEDTSAAVLRRFCGKCRLPFLGYDADLRAAEHHRTPQRKRNYPLPMTCFVTKNKDRQFFTSSPHQE